jgi:hypothetical protein
MNGAIYAHKQRSERSKMARKKETFEERCAFFNEALDFIAEVRPVTIKPFAKIVSKRQYEALASAVNSGRVMRCPETQRMFVPSRCVAA